MITGQEFEKILDCYKEELKIDKYSLEEECVRQPDLYAKYAKFFAEAEREVSLATLERNKVEAELDKEIQLRHEIHGFPKPPAVETIKRWIKAQPKYLIAQQNIIEAQYKFSIIDGIKWSLQHRKMSLEQLVNLFLNNYYSDIPVKGAKEVRDQEATERYKKQVDMLNEGNERLLKRRITNGS